VLLILVSSVGWRRSRRKPRGPTSYILKNVEHVIGVVGVIDLIALMPRASVVDVHKRIMEALKRHADIEASRIQVSAVNGNVTLSGTVESIDKTDRIEDAAWTPPGVMKVVDNLRVA
jgi:osmotically-inducible protein OsmY